MIRASIDIGSNTVLLLVAELNNQKVKIIEDHSTITGLGRGIELTGMLSEEALEDTWKAFENYFSIVNKYGIKSSEVIVTATEASRVAKNSKEFFKKVRDHFGFHVIIISSEGEAFYTALGVNTGLEKPPLFYTIMDIGGASTELIKVRSKPFEIIKFISLPMGSVRGTDWINEKIFDKKVEEIFSEFLLSEFKSKKLLCVAGSMTTLGGMFKGLLNYKQEEINGTDILFKNFKQFFEEFKNLSEEQILLKYPLVGKRGRTIVAGARVGIEIGNKIDVLSFEISTLGLRFGTLYNGGIDVRFAQ